MTVTERLLKDTESIWAEYHQHPFVQGIADGSLDKEKFKYYMIQDYLYLLDYTKVFAIGVAKAKDMAFMKRFANSTHAILDGEMDIHRSYMARLGIMPSGMSRELVGATPLHLLSQTAPLLKSPTGAFIAAQPQHSRFRRTQKIRTLLLSRKGSDFHCLTQNIKDIRMHAPR